MAFFDNPRGARNAERVTLKASALPAFLALAVLPAFAAEADLPPLETVDSVDLERYAGRWYEIARLPNRFQKTCASDVAAHYSLEPDGDILVHNTCVKENGEMRSATGEARVIDDSRSRLEVLFAPKWLGWLPMVWGDYWIIELDEDYQWAVVGEPGREYFWILARTPQLDSALVDELVERAESQGYRLDELVRTRHTDPLSRVR